MESPSTSLSLNPFLKHILRFPPPPPPWSHPTCAECDSLNRLQILEKFCHTRQMGDGWLEIHHMKENELEEAALVLAEPYSRAKKWSSRSIPLAAFMVKRYMVDRLVLIPHLALLVGMYKAKDGVEMELACIAEISLDADGAHPDLGTPRPPKEYPYIGNVAVKKTLRRKGIASELLRACEELIIRMEAKRKVYLHCSATDPGPFELYQKAGYEVVKKDSILVWLCFKSPRYLMSKELPLDEKKSDALDCNCRPI